MLRKGQVAEALTISRKMYAEEPDNVWNLRALIRSLCKSIWEAGESEQAQLFSNELNGLPALPPGDNDAELTDYRERSIRRADPLSQRLWAIRELSKNGTHGDALVQLRQIHREHPQRNDVDEALAWEIWHAIVDTLRLDEPDKGRIRNLLLEYRLLNVSKPSVIHSRILDVAARAAHDDAFTTFCGFLLWWSPTNLQPEDFKSNPGKDGKSFPSVVEHVIQGLGKAIKKETNPNVINFAAQFITEHYEKYPEQEWFPYYMAIALIRTGKPDAAKELLLPTVRKKQTETWAWHHLAECYESGDPARLACLCQAVLCGAREPQHLFPIRMELANELQSAGHLAQAKYEIEVVVRVREEHGWPIRGELLEMTRAEWYRSCTSMNDLEQYRIWARVASAVLTSGLPWHEAVLGVKDVLIGERKDRFAIIDVRTNTDAILSIPVKMRAFAVLVENQAGAALEIQMDDTSDRPLIVGLRTRNGKAWDILPQVPALVLRVNSERGVTTLLTDNGIECFCYHNDLPSSQFLIPGTFVLCSTIKDARRTKIHHVDIFDGTPNGSHWNAYHGPFRTREQGGGHVGDVFVHARLTDGLISGTTVRGIAVKKMDEQTRRSWWEAVSAVKSDE